jgi:hypothetical protein
MARMWHYINFFSHKPAKVTSDFILNYLKRVLGGATTQKNLRTNTKTLKSVNLQYNTVERRDDETIIPLSDGPMFILIGWE